MSKKEEEIEEIVARFVVSLVLFIFGLSGAIICGLSLFEINNELLDLIKYVLDISVFPLSIILMSSAIFLRLIMGRAFLSSIVALFCLLLIFDNLLLKLL